MAGQSQPWTRVAPMVGYKRAGCAKPAGRGQSSAGRVGKRSGSIQPGCRFGRLIVIEQAEPYYWRGKPHRRQWRCLCDCGQKSIVRDDHLRSGQTKSCECFHREQLQAANLVHGERTVSDPTPEYEAWRGLRLRCPGQYPRAWDRAGGAGFAEFLSAVGRRPTVAHRLTRVDPSKRWSAQNCQWVTGRKQAGVPSHWVVLKGRRMTLKNAAATTGVAYALLCKRLQRGWPLQRALEPIA